MGRPRYVSTPIGRAGALLYRLSPATIETLFNLGFRLLPDESDQGDDGHGANGARSTTSALKTGA